MSMTETGAFAFGDLLVSRTDKRGVIASGNTDFTRVSGYEWSELRGAPHKILRNPDMPKGVFFLFWEMLQQGQPIGAYVKNRCKDGKYYWVFACAAPAQGGYLSVRMKPGSKGVRLAEGIYKRVLALEAEGNLSPSESADKLCEMIKEAGYRDYAAFMSERISAEIEERNTQLGRKQDSLSEVIQTLAQNWVEIDRICATVSKAHDAIRHTPVNLGVQASRLQSQGVALAVIARNFALLAEKIQGLMASFQESAAEVEKTLSEARFLTAQSRLMNEVVTVFQSETEEQEGFTWEGETRLLQEKARADTDQTAKCLSQVRGSVQQFLAISSNIAFLLSGLSVSSVMCEIEGAYMNAEAQARVRGTSTELENFKKDTQAHLANLKDVLTNSVDLIVRAQDLIEDRSQLRRAS